MMSSKCLRDEAKDLNNYLGGNYDNIILDVQKKLNEMAQQREKQKNLDQKLLKSLNLI